MPLSLHYWHLVTASVRALRGCQARHMAETAARLSQMHQSRPEGSQGRALYLLLMRCPLMGFSMRIICQQMESLKNSPAAVTETARPQPMQEDPMRQGRSPHPPRDPQSIQRCHLKISQNLLRGNAPMASPIHPSSY